MYELDADLAFSLPNTTDTLYDPKTGGFCAGGRVISAVFGTRALIESSSGQDFWDSPTGIEFYSLMGDKALHWNKLVELNNHGQTELATRLMIELVLKSGKVKLKEASSSVANPELAAV